MTSFDPVREIATSLGTLRVQQVAPERCGERRARPASRGGVATAGKALLGTVVFVPRRVLEAAATSGIR